MLRRFLTPVASLLLLLASLPVQAAETALDAVSTDASVVIRFKKPKATIDKVADLVDLVVPGMGDQVRQQSAALGMAISNPTMAGVDMEADWFVAVYTDDDEDNDGKKDADAAEDPTFVFIVPATDLAAMKAALGDSFKFMEHGKLGVYSNDDATAKATAARLKGEGKSISTLIDKDSTAVFDNGDVSVFINVKQLAADYKDQIAEFKEQAKQMLENLPVAGAGAPGGVNTQQMAEFAGHALKFLSEGLEDTQSCTIAVVVSKDGLSFEDLVKVKSGSATDKLLAKSPAGALPGVSTLPAGHLAYFGLTWDMTDFAKLGQWGMGNAGLRPEVSKEMQDIMTQMSRLKVKSMISTFGLGDVDDGAVRSVSVTEVDNPTMMRELSMKAMKAMEKAEPQGVKQTYDIKKDAEKYGKNSADVITVKTEIVDPPDPTMAQLMERVMAGLFGSDGMTTRSVYLRDRVVHTLGGGKQAMTDALAAIEKPGASKSPVMQARGNLAAKSNVVFLLDLPNTIAKILEVVVQSQILPPVFPLDLDQIKSLQTKPSYFGLSAGTEPQGLRVKTHIPVEQMQGIAKIVAFVQQMMGGLGQ